MKLNPIKENKIKKMNCSICKDEIEVEVNGWYHGHNAKPVTEGRCCSVCNMEVVMPTRFMLESMSMKDGKLQG